MQGISWLAGNELASQKYGIVLRTIYYWVDGRLVWVLIQWKDQDSPPYEWIPQPNIHPFLSKQFKEAPPLLKKIPQTIPWT